VACVGVREGVCGGSVRGWRGREDVGCKGGGGANPSSHLTWKARDAPERGREEEGIKKWPGREKKEKKNWTSRTESENVARSERWGRVVNYMDEIFGKVTQEREFVLVEVTVVNPLGGRIERIAHRIKKECVV